MRRDLLGVILFGTVACLVPACSGDDGTESGTGASAGTGGSNASGGTGGGGTGGASASGGSGNAAGEAGSGNAAGSSGNTGGSGNAAGSAGDSGSGGSGGASDSGIPDVSFDYQAPDVEEPDACAAVTAEAVKPPVDIIWTIDQSGSMGNEIAQVKANVNGNFASIIQNAGLDYRVIMFSNGSSSVSSTYRLCVDPPLGSATCGENNPPIFFQVNRTIASTNSWSLFMNDTYWTEIKGHLRPDAFKAFIEVTDDQSTVTAAQFDAFLLTGNGAGYFGTAAERNYVFHSIVGVNAPLNPTDPKTNTKCGTAVNTGPQYQDLSILTGGLRHPVCDTDYSAVFANIATNIVKAVACELLTPPTTSDAGVIDWANVDVQYTPGDGSPAQIFPLVADEASCVGDGFYYDNPASPTKVLLCPDSCAKVQADDGAKVELLLGCLGS